jgi:Putative Actinobacterial Holin-X, holin superfamily III
MATGTTGTERTIGQLVADATHDIEGIVRGEIALAKAEVTDGAKVLGKGAGLFAGAAFLALMGLVFLLHSAAWGISTWLPVWAGYLIVAVVVLIIATILGLLGKKAFENARPAPERAIDQAQRTIAVIKEPFSDTDAVDAAAGAVAPAATGSATSGAMPPASGRTTPPASGTTPPASPSA